MKKEKPAPRRPLHDGLDELTEEITVDAYGEDEQLWAFRQVFEDEVALPSDAFVIGELVSVVEFDYDGNERRGLTAKCRLDGREYVVAASDVVFPQGTKGARYIAAYRKWMGLWPFPPAMRSRGKLRRESEALTTPAGQLVELAVLWKKQQTAHYRFLGNDRTVTLRSRRYWVPGEIVRVKLRKQWTYGDPHLSAEVTSTRIDAPALALTPLRLEDPASGIRSTSTGVRKVNRSNRGRSGSSPMARGRHSKWSRCYRAAILTIRFPTQSVCQTISGTLATPLAHSKS